MAEPIEAALDIADPAIPDPVEMLMRQEAVKTAVSRFAELPTLQRSVVILKDVLDEQLLEIAALLNLTVDAVKAIWRGAGRVFERSTRKPARFRARSRRPLRWRAMSRCSTSATGQPASAAGRRRELHQSTYPLRVGSADVGMFFTIYDKFDGVWLAPAWLEGREVIAVFKTAPIRSPAT